MEGLDVTGSASGLDIFTCEGGWRGVLFWLVLLAGRHWPCDRRGRRDRGRVQQSVNRDDRWPDGSQRKEGSKVDRHIQEETVMVLEWCAVVVSRGAEEEGLSLEHEI